MPTTPLKNIHTSSALAYNPPQKLATTFPKVYATLDFIPAWNSDSCQSGYSQSAVYVPAPIIICPRIPIGLAASAPPKNPLAAATKTDFQLISCPAIAWDIIDMAEL